ncbi:DUF420 domain-containing protein [Urechidicola sp. KH5]
MSKFALEKKYNRLIWVLSIVIPVAVAALFRIKIEVELPVFLPPIYATINAVTAVLLVWAVVAIKKGNRILHERIIKLAITCSVFFLVMYVLHHMTSDSTSYEGDYRTLYLVILISHIFLSVGVIPFVLVTYVRGLLGKFEAHKKIAKFTFPLWLYVAVTGVIVYVMISPYY